MFNEVWLDLTAGSGCPCVGWPMSNFKWTWSSLVPLTMTRIHSCARCTWAVRKVDDVYVVSMRMQLDIWIQMSLEWMSVVMKGSPARWLLCLHARRVPLDLLPCVSFPLTVSARTSCCCPEPLQLVVRGIASPFGSSHLTRRCPWE